MKKSAMVIVALLMAWSVSAQDMWTYAIQGVNSSANFSLGGADMSAYTGNAANTWTVNLLDASDSSVLGTTSIAAINAGTFYILGWTTPSITELTDVYYEIVSSDGFRSLSSSSTQLQNADAPLGATALDVANSSFNFSGSTWQAVPEPATVLLFGMGGLGAWLVRRKTH